MCPSGLRSTLGKRVSGQPFRRFESSRFRQKANIKKNTRKGWSFLYVRPLVERGFSYPASSQKESELSFLLLLGCESSRNISFSLSWM